MAQYIVPASLLMGQEAGESPGIDSFIAPGSLDPVPPENGPFTHGTIGLFADDTVTFRGLSDSPKETPATLSRTLFQLNSGGGGGHRVGTAVTGFVSIPGASFSGPLASQVVVLAPEDVGLNPNQIPPIKTALTNGQLSLFPAVFFRKSERVRMAFSQQGDISLDPVADGNPNVGAFPMVVPSAPLYSQWVVMVDGTAQTITIKHPDGSDLRRPRDIWEQVWLRYIADANNNTGQFLTYVITGPSPTVRGVFTRANYISYARFNAAFDAQGLIPLQPVYPNA